MSIDFSPSYAWTLHYPAAKVKPNNGARVVPLNIYSFKVNNRKRQEICSKLTIKTPERRQWRRSGLFIVNFEQAFASWDRSGIIIVTLSKFDKLI